MDVYNQTAQALPLSENFRCDIKHVPIKRMFDLFFSFFILVALSPLYFLIACAIRCSSKGKAFYSHVRVGRGGRHFKCYKFRTMHEEADVKLETLLADNSDLREEWEKSQKLKVDPRVTSFGKFLRKTSLDELPQFYNVLIGDLSVVGPRPVVQNEIDNYFGAKAYKILSIRPGITGLWQVSGRSDTSYETRIKLEEQYVDTHSFFFDLILILKTIPQMIFLNGAY